MGKIKINKQEMGKEKS